MRIREDEDLTDDKIYKPSGPDGRGWGEFRVYIQEEKQFMKEQKKHEDRLNDEGAKKVGVLYEKKAKVIADEDERWEKMLMKQNDEYLDGGQMKRLREKLDNEKKALKKEKKKMKKKKKIEKEKKVEKKEKKKAKKTQEG